MMESEVLMSAPLDTLSPRTEYVTEALTTTLHQRRERLNRDLVELSAQSSVLAEAAQRIIATLGAGNKVLIAGNGGSASEAQHFAAELVGRFKRDRSPFAAVALCTDTAVLTAVANDYGYEEVFARQVVAFGRPGDLLITISTSGESENLLRAAAAGHRCGVAVLAITGARYSRLAREADLALQLPDTDTALVQELQMIVTHLLCELVESELCCVDGGTPA